MTAATLFSGGGGADIGLSAAGLDVQWGLEYDDDIAQVARLNELDIHTGDVTEEAPSDWPDVDVLHASPPCPNFSVAKTGGEETDEDVSLAEATARFVSGIQPRLFTLENVWGYRKSQSWKLIREGLTREGYDWNAWKLNCADYGVAQTRKRMIVAARKGGPRPKKPPATHAEEPSNGGLFGGDLNKWVGWHEAIEDLIPNLPETELADWQKERLPDKLSTVQVSSQTVDGYNPNLRHVQEPSVSAMASEKSVPMRAVLVSNAFDTPQNGEDRKPQTYNDGSPSPPTTVQHDGRLRAVLINESSTLETSTADEPAASQVATQRNSRQRAVLGRRVVQMTPRALARFQSFPDWYDLPDSKSLACRIIGNAVPPLAMEEWVGVWLE